MLKFIGGLLVCAMLMQSLQAHDGPHSRVELGKGCIDTTEMRTQDSFHNECDVPVAIMWFCLHPKDHNVYYKSSAVIEPQTSLQLNCLEEDPDFVLSWGACSPLEGENQVMVTAASPITNITSLEDIQAIEFSCQVLQ